MMREEFEKLTGFYPTLSMYEVIEARYLAAAEDKTAFCKAFVKNTDGLADSIQREADMKALRERREQVTENEKLKAEIEHLKAQLEREQEWKPYEKVSKMSRDRYEELAEDGNTKHFSATEAALWISSEFGFQTGMIKIVWDIPTYEISRHNYIRKSGKENRAPVYNATDWNYIRFDCANWQYEVVNGQLYKYED